MLRWIVAYYGDFLSGASLTNSGILLADIHRRKEPRTKERRRIDSICLTVNVAAYRRNKIEMIAQRFSTRTSSNFLPPLNHPLLFAISDGSISKKLKCNNFLESLLVKRLMTKEQSSKLRLRWFHRWLDDPTMLRIQPQNFQQRSRSFPLMNGKKGMKTHIAPSDCNPCLPPYPSPQQVILRKANHIKIAFVLPDDILLNAFANLSTCELEQAARVCQDWNRAAGVLLDRRRRHIRSLASCTLSQIILIDGVSSIEHRESLQYFAKMLCTRNDAFASKPNVASRWRFGCR